MVMTIITAMMRSRIILGDKKRADVWCVSLFVCVILLNVLYRRNNSYSAEIINYSVEII